MKSLTARQKKFLQSLANSIKPTISVGKNGMTDNTFLSVRNAFNTHELLKIKILENCPDDPADISARISGESDSVFVGKTGHTLLFFRPDKKNPKIILPVSDVE